MNTSKSNFWIISWTVCFGVCLVSCNATEHVYHPGTEQSVRGPYLHLQYFGASSVPVQRDPSYALDKVLPQLHGWLSEGAGLKRKRIGEYSALMIDSLPSNVVTELKRITFPSTFKSGFAILQSDFWAKVADLQSRGFQIGIIDPKPQQLVAGVYFSGVWAILVDIFANEGVLTHEQRHHDQYLRLQQHANTAPLSLSPKCIAGVSKFFGELDSTTVELPTWIGMTSTLDVTPPVDMTPLLKVTPTVEIEKPDLIKFPQIGMLIAKPWISFKSRWRFCSNGRLPARVAKSGV